MRLFGSLNCQTLQKVSIVLEAEVLKIYVPKTPRVINERVGRAVGTFKLFIIEAIRQDHLHYSFRRESLQLTYAILTLFNCRYVSTDMLNNVRRREMIAALKFQQIIKSWSKLLQI